MKRTNGTERRNGRKALLGLVVGLLAAGFAAAPAEAQLATYDLVAGTATKTLPDGTAVGVWGFGLEAAVPEITVPGPEITVPPGQGLQINLRNALPVPVSVIIPSQAMPAVGGLPSQVVRNPDGRVRSFTLETPPGETRSYVWTSLKPGTHLYQSGTHLAVQVQMGLYGAVKHDAAAGEVYPGKAYDQDVTLLYSEIDPDFHAAVTADPSTGATVSYRPKYFLVNGQPFDPTDPDSGVQGTATAGETVLLRFLNAGLKTHAPQFVGLRASVLAEDGSLYPYPKDQCSLCLPAGKTADATVTPAAAGRYAVLDRRLFLSSGPGGTGGQLSYVDVQAAP